ncbi:DUF3102 domain-containing protein [Desulfitobacterium sp. THU1]|uniref:DUF3102 domain-containing protein n=1 Tax=Desulfitobacterium sp. THU1 TaxID=3138072 RepID=UPI00311F7449
MDFSLTPYPTSLATGTRTQVLPNLTYSKALLLLGIPEDERADFVAELKIEGMTTLELQKVVAEKKEALQENILIALRELNQPSQPFDRVRNGAFSSSGVRITKYTLPLLYSKFKI